MQNVYLNCRFENTRQLSWCTFSKCHLHSLLKFCHRKQEHFIKRSQANLLGSSLFHVIKLENIKNTNYHNESLTKVQNLEIKPRNLSYYSRLPVFYNWSKWSFRISFYNQIISTIQVLYVLRTIICMDHSSELLQYSRQSSSFSSERIEMRFSHFNEIHANINIMSCLHLGFITWR